MNSMQRLVMGAAVAGAFTAAWANPTTPTVVSGAALMSNPSASVMQVVNTPGTIINWQGFSIANGETTRFVQLNAASAVLNRVTGGNPSSILGRLESNGRVFLVNPNGIVFGGGSVVDVAGLIASTRDITDANFLAGNYLFNGFSNGAITVQNGAQILTSTYGPGGQVWLFAKNVTQEAGSTITAPQGQVVLAAGSQLQVGTNSLGAMTFAVETGSGDTVQALGDIVAARGAVGFFADQINIAGKISARSDANGAGNIVAVAGTDLTVASGGLLDVSADGANARAGSISLDAARTLTVAQGAEVLAESIQGFGGTIDLRANDILLPRMVVDPSRNDMFQNVRAFGRDQASDGVVNLQESGTFSVTLSTAPLTQQTYATIAANGDSLRRTKIDLVLPSGDGAILVGREDYNPATYTAEYSFEILRNGQRINLGMLLSVPNTYSSGSTDTAGSSRGLANGGWLWWRENVVRFISPAGQLTATVAVPNNAAWEVIPLPSGAVKMNDLFDDSLSRVYNAAGVELSGTNRTAALGAVRSVPFDYAPNPRSGRAAAVGPLLENLPSSSQIVPVTELNVVGQTDITTVRTILTRRGQSVAFPFSSISSDLRSTSSTGLTRQLDQSTNYLFNSSIRNIAMGGREIPILKTQSTWERLGTVPPTYTESITQQVFLATRTPTNTPAPRTSATGAVGAAASFATAPGVATDSGAGAGPTPPSGGGPSPAPAPLPAAAGGTGRGATFAGVSGCNSATCATEVRDALSITDAVRASQNVSAGAQRGRIDDRDAAAAVAALGRAQAGGNSAAARAQDEAIAIRDHGEMGRLMSDITNSLGNMTPAEVRQQTALLNTIVSDFMERELITQQLGLSRANPDAMDLVGALQNMNAEERAAFGMAIRNSQASGQP